MRFAIPIAIMALGAALLGGCGGSSESDSTAAPQGGAATAPAGASAQNCDAGVARFESLRATAVSCGEAKAVLVAWQGDKSCAGPPGASHAACTVRSYRCIGTRADRGFVVGCAGPGRSISFISRR
jgi:hypothetical protein